MFYYALAASLATNAIFLNYYDKSKQPKSLSCVDSYKVGVNRNDHKDDPAAYMEFKNSLRYGRVNVVNIQYENEAFRELNVRAIPNDNSALSRNTPTMDEAIKNALTTSIYRLFNSPENELVFREESPQPEPSVAPKNS